MPTKIQIIYQTTGRSNRISDALVMAQDNFIGFSKRKKN